MNEIVHERRRVSTDTALRLARYFETTPEFWMNIQRDYELKTVAASDEGRSIMSEVSPRKVVADTKQGHPGNGGS